MVNLKEQIIQDIREFFEKEGHVLSQFVRYKSINSEPERTHIIYSPLKFQIHETAFGKARLHVAVYEEYDGIFVYSNGIETETKTNPGIIRKILDVYDNLEDLLLERGFGVDVTKSNLNNKTYFKKRVEQLSQVSVHPFGEWGKESLAFP